MKDPNITGDVSKKGAWKCLPHPHLVGEKMAHILVLLEAEICVPLRVIH